MQVSLVYNGELMAEFAYRVTSIAVAGSNTCSLTTAGAVWCWGSDQGQLFPTFPGKQDAMVTSPLPHRDLQSGVTAIVAGDSFHCTLKSTGAVVCWGTNEHGTMGYRGNGLWVRNSPYPGEVEGLPTDVVAITAGQVHSCALTSAGAVLCWGRNTYGQLGDGTTTSRLEPAPVIGLSGTVTAISANGNHTCALKSDGVFMCWGRNDYGRWAMAPRWGA